MAANAASICLIAEHLDYLFKNSGIGTYNWLTAHLLAEQGWNVHILYCGPAPAPELLTSVRKRLAGAKINLWSPEELGVPWTAYVPDCYGISWSIQRSDQVRHALEELHRRFQFDLAEFAEFHAPGFRSIQAKQVGALLRDLPVIVKLHASSPWERDGNNRWMNGHEDLRLDFCERYAFEHADYQLSPCQYMLNYARSLGWKVRPDAQVVPYPLPRPMVRRSSWSGETPLEIVFFGRLEARKGLDIFLEGVQKLDPEIALTFVGSDTVLANGMPATEHIQARLPGRKLSLRIDLHREQALAYLAGDHRLAVLPSLMDNSPLAAIECMVNGIPFLASRVGGIPELVPDAEVQARLLFEPNARDLFRCLQSYLEAAAEQRRLLRQQVLALADVERTNQRVMEFYSGCLENARKTRRSISGAAGLAEHRSNPLVTIAVPHYNLGAYLPETLASLAAQTYENLEVLVIDDGSTDPASLQVFAEQQQRYPQFRFLHQINAGVGATRNRGLAEARGEFFLPVDADNIAAPFMVERFVAAMANRPGVAALTCYYLAFQESEEIARGAFAYAYRPTGGPHVLGSLVNVYGDANAIFRTSDLRAIGGFDTDRTGAAYADWATFVKLVNAGYDVGVVPEPLYYYRHQPDSMYRPADHYRSHQQVLRHYFQPHAVSEAERVGLWTAFVSLYARAEHLNGRLAELKAEPARPAARVQAPAMLPLRHQVADQANALLKTVPAGYRALKALVQTGRRVWRQVFSRVFKKAG